MDSSIAYFKPTGSRKEPKVSISRKSPIAKIEGYIGALFFWGTGLAFPLMRENKGGMQALYRGNFRGRKPKHQSTKNYDESPTSLVVYARKF